MWCTGGWEPHLGEVLLRLSPAGRIPWRVFICGIDSKPEKQAGDLSSPWLVSGASPWGGAGQSLGCSSPRGKELVFSVTYLAWITGRQLPGMEPGTVLTWKVCTCPVMA